MLSSAFKLLDLQPQDRIVTFENVTGYRDTPSQEVVRYVEAVDYVRECIHTLSPSGNSKAVPFADVGDIQKAEEPIMAVVPAEIWALHSCDPAFTGCPIRVLAVQMFRGSRISGIVVPKWPGARAGSTLTLPVSVLQHQVPEATLIRALPSLGLNPSRMGNPATARDRTYRTAAGRISKFLRQPAANHAPARMPASV